MSTCWDIYHLVPCTKSGQCDLYHDFSEHIKIFFLRSFVSMPLPFAPSLGDIPWSTFSPYMIHLGEIIYFCSIQPRQDGAPGTSAPCLAAQDSKFDIVLVGPNPTVMSLRLTGDHATTYLLVLQHQIHYQVESRE